MSRTRRSDEKLSSAVAKAGRVALSLAAAGVVGLLCAQGVEASSLDGFSGIDSPDLLRGQGWEQIKNLPELLELLIALALLAGLTAAIAFHPVVVAERRTSEDYQEPRSLFLYSLVGLLVGFMVMHHGYLIGFVIFGIGGLMRFKTDTGDLADTRRLIFLTLVGLCVGLNLPVMAIIATACAWVIINFLGRRVHLTLEVQFGSMKLTKLNIDILRDLLRERGFTVISANKHRFKAGADYVVVAGGPQGRGALVREMTAIQAAKLHGIDDWHVE